MRDVSSVEFSGAQQICYSHLPPGFFVSGQRRLWERQLSPTQSIGCWWKSRRFWWRSRETCRLFSCSCKDHKIFPPSSPAQSVLTCWSAGLPLWGGRMWAADRESGRGTSSCFVGDDLLWLRLIIFSSCTRGEGRVGAVAFATVQPSPLLTSGIISPLTTQQASLAARMRNDQAQWGELFYCSDHLDASILIKWCRDWVRHLEIFRCFSCHPSMFFYFALTAALSVRSRQDRREKPFIISLYSVNNNWLTSSFSLSLPDTISDDPGGHTSTPLLSPPASPSNDVFIQRSQKSKVSFLINM